MKPGLKKSKHLDGFINSRELEKLLDCTPQSLVTFKKDGRLPSPTKIFGKAHYWDIKLIPSILNTFEIKEEEKGN